MSEPPLVDVQNVTVRFARRRGVRLGWFRAVAEASLAIGRRQVVGLVGESGSGKTTLGRTILRLYEPEEGAVVFEGRDITHLRERQLRAVRQRMALVFQDPLSSFNPRHSIFTALATPLRITGVPASELASRVTEALRRVRLPADAAPRFPHELSGGQLQRAALARALMLSPAFVVADEAVSKLDVSVRSQVLNLLKDLQGQLDVAFLFITHDLHVARFLCDRVDVMFFGRIVESAPAATLFRAARHPYTRALLATLDHNAATPVQRGGIDPEQPGCIYRSQCPRRLPRCDERHPPTVLADAGHFLACYNPG
jgi:peptide/nickel transport system ATP-binding protein/oligopeptide transport system ATP-binding protein